MANVITYFRILFSAVLLFCPALSVPFYTLYLTAGFSDMLDGAVALFQISTSMPLTMPLSFGL